MVVHPAGADGPHFAVGNAIFGNLVPEHLAIVAAAGYPGIEIYRSMMLNYLDQPAALKSLLDGHGLTCCTISNGGPGMSCEFIDPAARARSIADHVAFARDTLAVLGCTYFKMNMGARPAGGTTDNQLHALADALNELGRATAQLGITLAPHPHIWGPVERPQEVRALMAYTDPAYIAYIPDSAQLNLGGGDPVALTFDYYDRIAAVHWKDSLPSYRGYAGPTPSQEEHRRQILYKDLGTGGVDLPLIWKMLQDRHYNGWVTLDLDPPRANEGEGSPADKLAINTRFLKERLHVAHL